MKIQKVILALATFAAMSAVPAYGADKTFGLRAGYNTRNESALAGLFFQYGFSEHFRLSPNVDYIFQHDDVDALSINCNVHMPFKLTQSAKTRIYPLAGLNYTSWNYHHTEQSERENDDVTTRRNRFGLNVGAGFEIRATSSLKISVEAKATLIKSYSSATISAAIGYIF